MDEWLNFINSNVSNERDNLVSTIYNYLLRWIVITEYKGGCHDTSAIFHIILKEVGIDNKLCIGEVKTGEQYFDHSWIEIDRKIYDPAICMPLDGGKWHPAIFASIDLNTKKETTLGYGVSSPVGLDEPASSISQINLSEYAFNDLQMPNRLWFMAAKFAHELGYELEADTLKVRYGNIKRELRCNSL